MLQTTFLPYSEKLRQVKQRRIAEKELSILNNKPLRIGDYAPDFSLYNSVYERVSLHDLLEKSNVVLLFFPLAFFEVCTYELCTIRDDIDKYNQLNASIIGISIDSMFALNKFKQEKQLQFDLLSDFNKDVTRKFRVFYEEFPLFNMKGVSKRAAFVINQNGIIQYVDILDNPEKIFDFEAIQQALDKCNEDTN